MTRQRLATPESILRHWLGASLLLCLALQACPAAAAPLDKSANDKINEAINVHYLATNFRKAEAVLKGTIKACGNKCSPATVARAWMYIGLVRGSGNQDLDGASEAFRKAVAADPNIKLDEDLATDEVKATFAAAKGDAGATEEVALEEDGAVQLEPDGASGAALPGGMNCTPNVSEVETRRAIPVSCTTDQPATRAVLYYKPFGAPRFSQINMGQSGDSWLGQIPCSATGLQGALKWYVVAQDASGTDLDSFGAARMPMETNIVESTTEPPPAHPGQEPPARCADSGDCPPEMRGTPTCPDTGSGEQRGDKSWGATCNESAECEPGLYCMGGTCESAPSCETNADCDSGICDNFVCTVVEGGGDSSDSDSGAPANLISIKLGWDLAVISGEDVCNDVAGTDFKCFAGSERYFLPTQAPERDPNNAAYNPTLGGGFGSAIAPGTVRIAASYERIFAEKFGLEAQVGIAFNGAPNTGTVELLHLAAYGKYWFSGTGPGLKLYGLVGGGSGQVDVGKAVTVAEIDNEPRSLYCLEPNAPECFINVKAYKKLGTGFIGAGIGGFLNLGGHGPALELQGKLMLPVTGVVIQPTLGYLFGF